MDHGSLILRTYVYKMEEPYIFTFVLSLLALVIFMLIGHGFQELLIKSKASCDPYSQSQSYLMG